MMTARGSLRLALLLLSLGAATAQGAGRLVEVEYPPSDQSGELIYGVTYRIWLPDGVERLRGIIVHQHGCGAGACQGGYTAAEDLRWQALARKWDCALLGPSYHQEDGQDCRKWCDPRNGSRARFLQALDDLAETSGHDELATIPWCLWGHSGGGFWASLMQCSDPERIVAIWLRSGTAFSTWEKGEIPRPEVPEAALAIPVMCNPGVKEKGDPRFNGAWTGTLAMFKAYRAKGAPIGFAPDPRTAHECGDSRDLAIPFFDACLAMRLPETGSDGAELRPVDRSRSWLAPVLGDRAEPAESFDGDPDTAVWLPDERAAHAWQEYVASGSVNDTTPPPAPVDLRATSGDGHEVELGWSAAADLESGIRQFLILRDGEELARLPETPQGRFGRPLFQSLSYHDTPEAPVPAMRFHDTTTSPGSTPTYQVITINGAGLRSEPSESVKPSN